MTPKRKAEELWLKYHNRIGHTFSEEYPPLYIKSMYMECALIAIEFAKENPLNTDGYNKYLNEVEIEIKKL